MYCIHRALSLSTLLHAHAQPGIVGVKGVPFPGGGYPVYLSACPVPAKGPRVDYLWHGTHVAKYG